MRKAFQPGINRSYLWEKSGLGKAPLTQYLGVPEEQQRLEPAVLEIEHKEGIPISHVF